MLPNDKRSQEDRIAQRARSEKNLSNSEMAAAALTPSLGSDGGKVSLNVAPPSDGAVVAAAAEGEVKWGTPVGAKRLRLWLREGPRSLRGASCLGGALVALSAFTSVFSDLLTLHPLRALVNLYLILFGVIVVLLELSVLRTCSGRCRMMLVDNAGFLAKVWGRGAFLIFVGTLAIAQHEAFHTLVGLFVTALGIADCCVSQHAETKLRIMRAQLVDETVLRAKFAAADADGDGTLSAPELATLSQELGSALNANELTRAFDLLDTDGDGKVSVDEFVAWMAEKPGKVSKARTAPLPPTLAPTPAKGGAAAAAAAAAGGAAAGGQGVSKGKPSFFAAAELKELTHWNTKGPCALRLMATSAGWALLLAGGISCLVELLALDLFTALIDFYIALLGGCVAAAEARKDNRLLGRFRPTIEANFKFMLKTWGRGVVLLFAGSLALGQLGSSSSLVETLNGLVGIGACVVGASSCCVGSVAAQKMAVVKSKLETQGSLRETFDRFDVDKSGTLDVAELGALCQSLGQSLTHTQLEEAVLVLDSNRDGEIQYGEFVHWWQQGHDYSHDGGDDATAGGGAAAAGAGSELAVSSPQQQSVGVASV